MSTRLLERSRTATILMHQIGSIATRTRPGGRWIGVACVLMLLAAGCGKATPTIPEHVAPSPAAPAIPTAVAIPTAEVIPTAVATPRATSAPIADGGEQGARPMRLTIYDDGRSCPAGCDAHVVLHPSANGTANAHDPAEPRRPYRRCTTGQPCRICFDAAPGSCITVMYRGGGPHQDAFDFTPAFYEEWCAKPELPQRLAAQCRALQQAARRLDGKLNCSRNPDTPRCATVIGAARSARAADQPLYDECLRLGEAAFNRARPREQQRIHACAYEKFGTGRNSQGRTWRKLLPAACREETYVGRDGLDCCTGSLFADGSLGVECRGFYLDP